MIASKIIGLLTYDCYYYKIIYITITAPIQNMFLQKIDIL